MATTTGIFTRQFFRWDRTGEKGKARIQPLVGSCFHIPLHGRRQFLLRRGESSSWTSYMAEKSLSLLGTRGRETEIVNSGPARSEKRLHLGPWWRLPGKKHLSGGHGPLQINSPHGTNILACLVLLPMVALPSEMTVFPSRLRDPGRNKNSSRDGKAARNLHLGYMTGRIAPNIDPHESANIHYTQGPIL